LIKRGKWSGQVKKYILLAFFATLGFFCCLLVLCVSMCVCVFIILGLGFELRASSLLGRHSTMCVMSQHLFCFRYVFGKGSPAFCPGNAQIMIILQTPPTKLDLQVHSSMPSFFWGGGLSVCSGWPQSMILPIFASWLLGLG
jgi:hypothetical protein